jgi:hypothetical protein
MVPLSFLAYAIVLRLPLRWAAGRRVNVMLPAPIIVMAGMGAQASDGDGRGCRSRGEPVEPLGVARMRRRSPINHVAGTGESVPEIVGPGAVIHVTF